ncbi:MAG: MurT ligase domain-containing protein [Eubacteriales bacterium]|nr:MurT ligase domain-containing protein [Lachnospiraceae bacterium]MDO5127104.1 MurT ligase domain-containing protein [Eubacteriales bacterium]
MKKLKFLFGLWVGKVIVVLTKLFAKERGTNVPGVWAMKFSKDFLSHFTNINYDKVIFITGTNGKSTTNNMIVHCLQSAGKTVATNLEGANLITGVATAMIKNATLFGRMKTEYMIFETDERFLQHIYKQLPAKNICVTNIQKDQVQRNGEPDYIYKKIQKVITKDTRLFLNNQEPRSKSLERFAGQVVYYGMDRTKYSYTKDGRYDVTMPCPCCDGRIAFAYHNVENVGQFKCEACGFASEDSVTYLAKDIDFEKQTFMCEGKIYHVQYTQPFFIYNYILCIALCKKYGITDEQIDKAFGTFKNIGGRFELLRYKDKEIKYVRIKQENPETLQTALNYISMDRTNKVFVMGLAELTDFDPYYTNTFYAFDCDFKDMEASNVDHYICFSEAVAYDSANRLIYEGIPSDKITILPTQDAETIMKEIEKHETNNVYLITWLHTYYDIQKFLGKN